MVVSQALEKQQKAIRLLNDFQGKRKATVKQLQVLTGYLNFLTRAIFAGCTVTRRIYAKYSLSGRNLKQCHHINLDKEFHFDIDVWRVFLVNYQARAVCRLMVDVKQLTSAQTLKFYSDVSAKSTLGFGAIFNTKWIAGKWELGFINQCKPSIEYLKLFALTAAILMWGKYLQNNRIIIFCDNASVVQMVNQTSSSCKKLYVPATSASAQWFNLQPSGLRPACQEP